MTFYWQPHPSGEGWRVFLEEVALNVDPHAKQKYQTWFIYNLQPDGMCMNCRQRRGNLDPRTGSYTCDFCQAECDAQIAQLLLRKAA